MRIQELLPALRRELLASAIVMAISGPALAQGYDGYEYWQKYSISIRQGYVTGAMDMLAGHAKGPDLYHEANREGIHVCLAEFQLSINDMVNMIDKFYEINKDKRQLSAYFMLNLALRSICYDYINASRVASGLKAMK